MPQTDTQKGAARGHNLDSGRVWSAAQTLSIPVNADIPGGSDGAVRLLMQHAVKLAHGAAGAAPHLLG